MQNTSNRPRKHSFISPNLKRKNHAKPDALFHTIDDKLRRQTATHSRRQAALLKALLAREGHHGDVAFAGIQSLPQYHRFNDVSAIPMAYGVFEKCHEFLGDYHRVFLRVTHY